MQLLAEEYLINEDLLNSRYYHFMRIGMQAKSIAARDFNRIIRTYNERMQMRANELAKEKPNMTYVARLDKIIANLNQTIEKTLPFRQGCCR